MGLLLLFGAEQTTQSASFSVDAVLQAEQASSFTLNAIISVPQSGGLTFDAVLLRTQAAATTLDAVLRRTQSSGLTLDAVLQRVQAGSFTLDAIRKATATGTLPFDAVKQTTQASSLTLDAIKRAQGTGAPTFDAILKAQQTGSFSFAAVISRPQAGSFTLSSILKATQSSSLTLDAVKRAPGSGSFTLNAVRRAAGVGSVTFDAVRKATASSSSALNAILKKTQTGSFTMAAVIRVAGAGSFTLDAIRLKHWETGPSSYVGPDDDENVVGPGGGMVGPGFEGILLSAWLMKTVTGTVAFNAVLRRTQSSSFTLNAVIRRTGSGAVTFDAVIGGKSFTLDAMLALHVQASFSLSAVIATERYRDVFGRVVPVGFGTNGSSTYIPDPSTPDTNASVDGSKGIISTGVVEWGGIAVPRWGQVQFDIYSGPLLDGEIRAGYVSPRLVDVLQSSAGLGFSGSTAFLWLNTFGDAITPTLDPDTWYTAKFHLHPTIGTPIYAKVWKVGDPEPDWMLEAVVSTSVAGDNVLIGQSSGTGPFWIDNFIWVSDDPVVVHRGSFTFSAVIANAPLWTFESVIVLRRLKVFDLTARLERGFRLQAWIGPHFSLSSWIRKPQSSSFTLNAEIVTTAPTRFSLDARIYRQGLTGSFALSSWLDFSAHPTGSFTLSAWIVGTRASFVLSAQISDPSTETGSFTMDASISATYRQGSFSLAATIVSVPTKVFDLASIIGPRPVHAGSFTLSAVKVARFFTLGFDAYIERQFKLSAIIGSQHTFGLSSLLMQFTVRYFTLDAVIGNGGFTLNAVISVPAPSTVLPLLSIIRAAPSGSFSLNALKAGGFRLNAFIQPYFTLGAYIWNPTGTPVWPPDGGPPIDPGTGLPWEPPARKARVAILVDQVDVTQYVVWSECEFVQSARVSPGKFTLTLQGRHTYVGGEEVLVLIDDFRQFGGIAQEPENATTFPDLATEDDVLTIKTVISGSDFGILFDRITVWNAEKYGDQVNDEHGGEYTPIPEFPKDSWDQDLILAYWSRFIDVPWKKLVDVHVGAPDLPGDQGRVADGVDRLAVVNPETPFVWESGHSMRDFMQGIIRQTNGIFWMDPYYVLQYHRRSNATAPYAITEGAGGISCRNLQISRSIASMINDNIVLGTLAQTVEGKIIYSRHKDEANVGQYGLWQYMEVHSDLHLQTHVNLRGKSIQERSDLVMLTARCEIFEKGFQAGQVATVTSAEYGFSQNLVIREQRLTFVLDQGTADGVYYAWPKFELELGLQPEDPWAFYDALPFEFHDLNGPTGFPRFQMPYLQLWSQDGGSGLGSTEICVDAPTTTVIFRDDFDRTIPNWLDASTWGNGGCQPWLSEEFSPQQGRVILSVPPPWCVTLGVTPGFILTNDNGSCSINGNTLTWQLRSQQADAAGSTGNGGSATLPWATNKPVFVRWRRLLGQLTVAVWPQDNSHPGVVKVVNWAPELTFWPDSILRLQFLGGGRSQGIAVAAGGGGTGVLVNVLEFDGGVLRGSAAMPPRTIELDVLEADYERTWSVGYHPPNDVQFNSPGGYYTVDQTSGGASVNWGILNGVDLDSGKAQIYFQGFPFEGRILPPSLARLRFTGTVNVNGIGNFLFFLSYMPNYQPLPWVIALTNYNGGSDFQQQGTILDSGFVVPLNPSDAVINVPYDSGNVEAPASGRFQFSWRNTDVDSIPPRYPTETPFNLFITLSFLNLNRNCWFAEWDDPVVACGSTDPIGGFASCEVVNVPVPFEFGWGAESKVVQQSGSFVLSLPATPQTLQVYVDGKLQTPEVDYVRDGEDGMSFKMNTVPRGRCVRVAYHAPSQTLGTQFATRVEATADMPADRERLPDIRGN